MITILLATAGAPMAQAPAPYDAAAAESQYRALAADPAAMPDRLFVLQENAIGLREQAIAKAVAARATDPAVREIAARFADAHGQGVAALRKAAGEIGIAVPHAITPLETAQIDALGAMPPRALEDWWLLHQRAVHAWDIATFADYAGRTRQPTLAPYVRAVIAPLRAQSAEIDRLAATRGIGAPPPSAARRP